MHAHRYVDYAMYVIILMSLIIDHWPGLKVISKFTVAVITTSYVLTNHTNE